MEIVIDTVAIRIGLQSILTMVSGLWFNIYTADRTLQAWRELH